MYKIIGKCFMGNAMLMGCQVDNEMEFFNESELVFLSEYGVEFSDPDGNKLVCSSGQFIGDIPDLTAAVAAYEDEVTSDEFDMEGYDLEDSSEDLGLGDDYAVPDEDLDGFDFGSLEELEGEADEDEFPLEFEDLTDDTDTEASLYIPVSDDDQLVVDYYWDWRSKGATVSIDGDDAIEQDEVEKTVIGDSTESRLYNYVTESQRALLQEYYLYISKRIFNLERGVNDLTVKRQTDLDGVRNTGGTWIYAGFIDMGYAGTSLCPYCNSILSRTSLSTCHNAPVVNVRGGKPDKKGKMKMRYVARTHNGQCSYPGCTSRCSVVTSTVGIRELDRSRQQGIICQNCGKLIPQSSHYCTFNDPVRLMHIAWDVSASDLETNFYGQMVTDGLEKLINSNNCIKFGLGCVAEFFDISKTSEAFYALKNVQTVCLKDMAQLEEEYATGDERRLEIINSFGILDAIVDKLLVIASKQVLLKGDDSLPSKLLFLYKKMRAEGMIIPKSFIQFIRDLLLDWDRHKFVDGQTKGLSGDIGSIYGAMTRDKQKERVDARVELMLNGLIRARKDDFYRWILGKEEKGSRQAGNCRALLMAYTTAILVYKICGYYAYNALTQTDEGGRSANEGGSHATALRWFYRSIERSAPKDLEYTYDYFKRLFELGAHVYELDALVVKLSEDRDTCNNMRVGDLFLGDVLRDVRTEYSSFRYYKSLAEADAKIVECFNQVSNLVTEVEAFKNHKDEGVAEDGQLTVIEVLDYLKNADLSGKQGIGVAILNTVLSSGKEPTSRQFYHLRKLYEEVSGSTYTGSAPVMESQSLTSEFSTAFEYIKNHSDLVDDFVITVCTSVSKRGSASKKQMYYVNKMIDAYNKAKGGN